MNLKFWKKPLRFEARELNEKAKRVENDRDAETQARRAADVAAWCVALLHKCRTHAEFGGYHQWSDAQAPVPHGAWKDVRAFFECRGFRFQLETWTNLVGGRFKVAHISWEA